MEVLYIVRGLWLATGYGLLLLMYGDVVGYGQGDLSFCAFTIIITHPHPVT